MGDPTEATLELIRVATAKAIETSKSKGRGSIRDHGTRNRRAVPRRCCPRTRYRRRERHRTPCRGSRTGSDGSRSTPSRSGWCSGDRRYAAWMTVAQRSWNWRPARPVWTSSPSASGYARARWRSGVTTRWRGCRRRCGRGTGKSPRELEAREETQAGGAGVHGRGHQEGATGAHPC